MGFIFKVEEGIKDFEMMTTTTAPVTDATLNPTADGQTSMNPSMNTSVMRTVAPTRIYEVNSTDIDCICIALWDPVCCDGNTYSNSCHASCDDYDDTTDCLDG